MSRPQFDEFGAILDSRRTPACLIGRAVRFHYTGGNSRQYASGTIAEHLGGMRFGVRVDGYTAHGHNVTVDMHRGEFSLPGA
jgi:hypothetical protein